MTYLNIYWKGYPHRHLPRIRLPSCHGSIRSPTTAATTHLSRKSLSPTLQKERKKTRFKIRFRRRGSRSARSSSSTAQARRKVSLKARQNIKVFGWDSPQADLASKISTLYEGSNLQLFGPGARAGAEFSSIHHISHSTALQSDGAGSSVIRQVRDRKKEKSPIKAEEYSVNRVAKVPVYWTSDKFVEASNRFAKPNKDTNITVSSELPSPSRIEDREIRPFATVSKRSTCQNQGRTRSYDPRIDPGQIGKENRSKGNSSQPDQVTRRRTGVSRTSEEKIREKNLGNPALWTAVNQIVLQPKKQGANTQSIKSLIQTITSDASSRTPSQKKTLQKFTKELEAYLQAARNLPKQSSATSLATTTISAHTITELKPFQAEFQSAGLAVTSSEQRGMMRPT